MKEIAWGLSPLEKSDRNERKLSGFGRVLQNENLVRKNPEGLNALEFKTDHLFKN